MQIVHRTAFAIIAAAVTAGSLGPATSGSTAPTRPNQQSAPVRPTGFEPASVVKRGPCKVWINTKKLHGRWNAQGVVYSSSTVCGMKLERSHKRGKYKQISNFYLVKNGGQRNTGWHYDDHGYKTRVCLNLGSESSWHCGKGI
ncbi:hypothetical protein [Actinomadura bangladeshensis]|uniref:DUF2690 domain-containing protein n=1 Tax=Actinomadura bangladeshensis TaxID=453573 RepID=A0A4R4NE40_9ACTN|nr:hypothetical protein [Actinomadura bangladeshensis]TDC05447.1 hypothetical protein E1284_35390 [Actinomadura bangladeshensis]